MLDLRIRLEKFFCPFLDKTYQGPLFNIFTRPPKSSPCDMAFPCFIPAKKSGLSPKAFAECLAKTLPEGGMITRIKAEGPYLNMNIDTKGLLAGFIRELKSSNPFAPLIEPREKYPILIEYSQPNTHKLFHIGHIRNVAVGDSLVRILRYNGRNIISLNYIGDIGAHIARFLWFFKKSGRVLQDFNDGSELGRLYVDSSLYLENLGETEKIRVKKEISEIQKALEDKSCPDLTELWEETRSQSLEYFHDIYRFLNARFDRYYYESEVEQEGIKTIKEYLSRGVFTISQGAVVIELGGNLETFLLLKSDGTSLYSTKDIALALKKEREYHPGLSLYVVGSEQVLYFKQLIETLRRMGFDSHDRLRHVSYELVTLKDEKMSSRYGNIVSFHDLKKAIYDNIMTSYIGSRDWDSDKKKDTLYKIALATIRYGMVSKSLNKKIVFNLEEWLKPEGDTGAYILYTIARINSILARSDKDPHDDLEAISHEPEDIEKSIIISLSEFSYTVLIAEERLDPSILANYIFELCKEFNRFYHQCPVIHTSREGFIFRFNLIKAVKAVLEKGVSLLGFYPVTSM